MRRFVPLILVLLLLSGGALAFSGQGTRLDPASLPEGWVVTGDWLASPGDLEVFSERLGVQVELLRNYVLKAPQGTIQVNLVLTATEEEAEDLYELFLSFHGPEEVARQGRRVVEMVTQQPGLLEPARAALRFLPEEVDPAKGAALKEYLARWSWPVMDWGDLTARLSQELGRYRLFLVGESHGTAFNQELEGALLLLELPPSIAGFLQKYLETGDEELLKLAFAETRHTYFYTQERYNLWRRLRALQESLPEGERLHLVGLDVEQQPICSIFWTRWKGAACLKRGFPRFSRCCGERSAIPTFSPRPSLSGGSSWSWKRSRSKGSWGISPSALSWCFPVCWRG